MLSADVSTLQHVILWHTDWTTWGKDESGRLADGWLGVGHGQQNHDRSTVVRRDLIQASRTTQDGLVWKNPTGLQDW